MSSQSRRITDCIGESLLIGFDTVHIDRAGQTRELIVRLVEIVEADSAGMFLAVGRDGVHYSVPNRKVFTADDDGYLIPGRKRPVKPAYIAVHQVIRDFHAVSGRPVRAGWLTRAKANALLASPSGRI